MHKTTLVLFLIFGTFKAFSLQTDTSAYQTQRLKVNALLAARSANFGQYEESLTTRTGIFGLQTKKDIRNSNEILRQLVLNDNNIFKELKVLMDYKDLEVKQVKTDVIQRSDRIQNYQLSIKQLQDQNEQLHAAVKSVHKEKNSLNIVIFLLIFSIAVLIWFLIKKPKPI
jgi:hypothetical protein